MKIHRHLKKMAFLTVMSTVFLLSNSGNGPDGNTGAPFDGNCANCHNGGSYTGSVTITGLPASITPNTTYNLSLNVNGNSPAAGFQLVAVDGSNANAGDLTAGNAQSGTSFFGGREYLDQRGAKPVSGGVASWSFTWVSPASAAGNQIKFYMAGNMVNGSGTSGDVVVNNLITLPISGGAAVNATITNTTPVTCNGQSNGSATVSASGGTGSFTYAWSNGQSTATATGLAAGTYTVTVTSGGATTTATATITQPSPLVVSVTGGSITCSNPSVALNASGSGGNSPYSFNWSTGGSGNSISVNASGLYTVTITDNRGCTSTNTVSVTANTTPPVANAGPSQMLGMNGTTTLNGAGSSSGSQFTYQWTTTNGSILSGANTLTPTVNAVGTYTLRVTNTQNGCFSTASTNVTAAATIPVAVAGNNFTVTCATPNPVQLSGAGSSTGPEFNYLWQASGGGMISSGANTLTPTITAGGTYNLQVTNVLSGQSANASVTVTWDRTAPTVNATGGTITCASPCALLTATATAGSLLNWSTGATTSSISPCSAGTYTVVATGANSCTASATATVATNTTPPSTSVSPSSVTLQCGGTGQTITGTIPSGNFSGVWSGPGVNTTTNSITVTASGTYTWTVTNLTNGCTASASASASGSISAPVASINASSTILTCANPQITLDGASTINGSTFAWSGPNNYSSILQSPIISTAGTYVVTVSAPTGCTATSSVTISADNSAPSVSISGNTLLNCTNNIATLTASAVGANVSFQWNGPNGFTSNQAVINVSAAGTYTVVVSSPNGCSGSASTVVSQDLGAPQASISASATSLNCATGQVSLSGVTSSPVAAFAWTGPGGFGSGQQNITVSNAGTYTLVVTGFNGCTSSASIAITADQAVPVVNVTASQNALTCTNTQSTISVSSSVANSSFAWTGPNGFTSNQSQFTISTPGTYSVIVTSPNGCSAVSSIAIQGNSSAPQIIATGGMVTCAIPFTVLTASSTQPVVSYVWYDQIGNQLTSTTVGVGVYTVVATGTNGCTASATATVTGDFVPPFISVNSATITCSQSVVTLSATSVTPNITYAWSGPNGYTAVGSSVLVNQPGNYTVTATNPSNGCTEVATSTVTSNTSQPIISAQGGVIPCSGTLKLTMIIPAGATVTWVGPNGFMSNQPEPEVFDPGVYTATVTNPVSGCTSITTITVTKAQSPSFSVTTNGDLTCANSSVQICAVSPISAVAFLWSNGATTPCINATQPGNYTVVVTALGSGCTATGTATVNENTAPPQGVAINNAGGMITCTQTSINVTATSSTPGAQYAWSNGITGPVLNVQSAGTYVVTVTNPVNGCTSTAMTSVQQSADVPMFTATGGVLNCNTTSVALQPSGTVGGVVYTWTGPNGALTNPPLATASGVYVVVGTGANGCSAVQTVSVTQAAPIGFTYTATPNCNGTYTFAGIASGGQPPYTWATPTPLVGGTYTITITDAANCTSVQTFTLANNPVLSGSVANITSPTSTSTNNGSVTINVSGGTAPFTFAWTKTGSTQVISTNKDLVGVGVGVYAVVITDAKGCTFTLNGITIMASSTKEAVALAAGLTIFPNPTTDELNLNAAWDNERFRSIEVLDLRGRLILQVPAEGQQAHIRLGDCSAGTYICRVITHTGSVVHKLVQVHR